MTLRKYDNVASGEVLRIDNREAILIRYGGQSMLFSQSELAGIVPHDREIYIESRLRVLKRIVDEHHRITPAQYRKAAPIAPTPADVVNDLHKRSHPLRDEPFHPYYTNPFA